MDTKLEVETLKTNKIEFNEAQQAALDAPGTTLLVAVAGSGKTRVLTQKVAKVIKDGINPNRVLALTFTNKAANEMRERLECPELLGYPIDKDAIDSPWIGTIHSLFFRILKSDLPAVDPRYAPRIIPLDDYGRKRMIEDILKAEGYKSDDPEWDPCGILRAIDAAQSAGHCYEDAAEYFYGETSTAMDAFVYKVWGLYIKKKLQGDQYKNKFVDFSDMITLTVKMFREHLGILAKWQSKWDYILVDEFQDTDTLQAEGIRSLSACNNNLFAVGDPRQLVYGFRGAQIDLTTNFEGFFPNGNLLFMGTNYRSATKIVSKGNQLIRFADFDVPDAEANRTDNGSVEYLGHFGSDIEEAGEVVGTIKCLVDAGARKPGDFAIVYRTNSQSLYFEDALMRAEIPYVIQGSHGFYAREEIKDMVAYLAIIHEIRTDYQDNETREMVNALLMPKNGFETKYGCFERVMNKPNRYLGKAFLREWANHVRRGIAPLDALRRNYARSYMERGASEFAYQLLGLVSRNPDNDGLGNLVADIRDTLEYDKYISKNFDETIDNPKIDNLNALQGAIAEQASLKSFLVYAGAMAKPETDTGVSDKSVKLMTVHRSKGLEFPVVFVVGLSEGLLPHWQAVLSGDVEEERRIAYVALTRAEDTAYLSGFVVRNGKGEMQPSRFITEMGFDL